MGDFEWWYTDGSIDNWYCDKYHSKSRTVTYTVKHYYTVFTLFSWSQDIVHDII